MKNRILKWSVISFLLLLSVGIQGFIEGGYPFFTAVYQSLQLFIFAVSFGKNTDVNLMLETARFLSPMWLILAGFNIGKIYEVFSLSRRKRSLSTNQNAIIFVKGNEDIKKNYNVADGLYAVVDLQAESSEPEVIVNGIFELRSSEYKLVAQFIDTLALKRSKNGFKTIVVYECWSAAYYAIKDLITEGNISHVHVSEENKTLRIADNEFFINRNIYAQQEVLSLCSMHHSKESKFVFFGKAPCPITIDVENNTLSCIKNSIGENRCVDLFDSPGSFWYSDSGPFEDEYKTYKCFENTYSNRGDVYEFIFRETLEGIEGNKLYLLIGDTIDATAIDTYEYLQSEYSGQLAKFSKVFIEGASEIYGSRNSHSSDRVLINPYVSPLNFVSFELVKCENLSKLISDYLEALEGHQTVAAPYISQTPPSGTEWPFNVADNYGLSMQKDLFLNEFEEAANKAFVDIVGTNADLLKLDRYGNPFFVYIAGEVLISMYPQRHAKLINLDGTIDQAHGYDGITCKLVADISALREVSQITQLPLEGSSLYKEILVRSFAYGCNLDHGELANRIGKFCLELYEHLHLWMILDYRVVNMYKTKDASVFGIEQQYCSTNEAFYDELNTRLKFIVSALEEGHWDHRMMMMVKPQKEGSNFFLFVYRLFNIGEPYPDKIHNDEDDQCW